MQYNISFVKNLFNYSFKFQKIKILSRIYIPSYWSQQYQIRIDWKKKKKKYSNNKFFPIAINNNVLMHWITRRKYYTGSLIFWIWYTLYKCHVNESTMRNYHITNGMCIKYTLSKRRISDYIFTIDRVSANFPRATDLFAGYTCTLKMCIVTTANMRIFVDNITKKNILNYIYIYFISINKYCINNFNFIKN